MLVVLLLVAIIAWIVIGAVGFIVKGLFWLFVVACVLFVLTVLFSAFQSGRGHRRLPR